MPSRAVLQASTPRARDTPRARAAGDSSACSKNAWPNQLSSSSARSRLNSTTSASALRAVRPTRRQVARQAGLELGEQHEQLVLPAVVGHRRRRRWGRRSSAPAAASSATRLLGRVVGRPAVTPVAAAAARRSACLAAARHRRGRRSRRRCRPAPSAARPRRPPSAAIGPAVSCDDEIGTMPVVGSRPTVGLMPDAAVERGRAGDRAVGLGADGESATRPAATAAPLPALDPPADRFSPYGLRVRPPYALQPDVEPGSRMLAHSLRLALPTIDHARARAAGAPAGRRRGAAGRPGPASRPSSACPRCRCCP